MQESEARKTSVAAGVWTTTPACKTNAAAAAAPAAQASVEGVAKVQEPGKHPAKLAQRPNSQTGSQAKPIAAAQPPNSAKLQGSPGDKVPGQSSQKSAQKPSPQTASMPANAPAAGQGPKIIEVPPMANTARPRKRHYGILVSFCLTVLLPTFLAGYYMYAVAVDQYESRLGFVVRTEESQSALDVLSGFTGISGASSSDTDILYAFIQSQEMVRRIDAHMDLRSLFSKPEFDPIFALHADASLEELTEFWSRMVRVYYDGATGLIEVRTHAFSAGAAQELARRIYDEASDMINALSDVARKDATRYAEEERDKAIERLIAARQAMTGFRVRTQIVDPRADVEGQMGLLSNLQSQLAEVLIEQDLMLQTSNSGDPRLAQLQLRIDVIEDRIAAERRKLGVGGQDSATDQEGGFASLLGEYERLLVDQEFAEAAYVSALSAYDAALSEAQRKSRYLAIYLRPITAETSTLPNRPLLTGLIGGFVLILWFVGVLIYYSFRDRR